MTQNHPHPHGHDHNHHKPGWKPHRDWRFWGVILMLVGIAIYVLTLDESMVPGGGAPAPKVPAAAP